MAITQRKSGDVTILDMKGKVTIGVGDIELRNAVQEQLNAGAQKLVLNMKDVTTIDSSGIGELVASYTATTHRGGKLVLANLPPKINDILHITQLISVFTVFDDEAEAIASLA